MVANRRESRLVENAAEMPATLQVFLRNKLSTASQLLQALHRYKQRLSTRAPPTLLRPVNQNQRDAETYRLSQMCLLTDLTDFLMALLQSAIESFSALSLGQVLQNSPRCFLTEFRAAIHETLRTRSPDRIRRSGFQRVVWAVWVCTLWICLDAKVDFDGALGPTHEQLVGWTRFIKGRYGEPLTSRRTACIEGDVVWERRASGADSAISTECTKIADSCLGIVKAAAAKHPECIYADPRWTLEFLTWGSEVAFDSLMMYPTFEEMDEIEPELLLVLEP